MEKPPIQEVFLSGVKRKLFRKLVCSVIPDIGSNKVTFGHFEISLPIFLQIGSFREISEIKNGTATDCWIRQSKSSNMIS